MWKKGAAAILVLAAIILGACSETDDDQAQRDATATQVTAPVQLEWLLYDGRSPDYNRTIVMLNGLLVGSQYPAPMQLDGEPKFFVVTEEGLVRQAHTIASSGWGEASPPPFPPPGPPLTVSRFSRSRGIHDERFFLRGSVANAKVEAMQRQKLDQARRGFASKTGSPRFGRSNRSPIGTKSSRNLSRGIQSRMNLSFLKPLMTRATEPCTR